MYASSAKPDQTPRSVASDLVCTVCIRPIKRTPGFYGLTNMTIRTTPQKQIRNTKPNTTMMHKSLDQFEFRSDPTTDYGVSCPLASEK